MKILFLTLLFMIGCQTQQGLYYQKGNTYVVYSSVDARSTQAFLNSKDLDVQMKSLIGSLRKRPRNMRAYHDLAQLYLASGQTMKAHQTVEKSLKVDFRSRRSRILKAAVAYRRNRDAEAKMLLELLGGERAPEAHIPFYLASIALRKGDSEESRRLLQIAIQKDPKFVAAYMNLGLFYLKNYQSNLAKSYFRRVLKLAPGYDDARMHLAILDAMDKKFDDALDVYDDLHSRHPKNGLVVLNRGVLHLRQGHIDEAFDDLQSYLDDAEPHQKSRNAAQTLWSGIQAANKKKKSFGYNDVKNIENKINRLKPDYRKSNSDAVENISGFVFTPKGVKPLGI